MTRPDWIIVALYLAAMVGMSLYLGRGMRGQDDYYVGGRRLPWWAVGMSTMATQTSAISFISIPAFVALKPGGGLTWLQYELAVPLAMIAVTVALLPFFRSLELISVYEYLELRFGPSIRYLVSAVFLISRGLGTGVGVYASGILLSVMLDVPLWVTLILMGAVTVAYDTIGGIRAVVYSDVVQLLILMLGLALCIAYALVDVGGPAAALEALPAERWRALDLSTGVGDGSSTPFWGFLLGGLVLYLSYYGVDQSQVQRELSAASVADTRRSLYLNGFARFPLTLAYVALGLAVGAAYMGSPGLQAEIAQDRLDLLVPVFIIQYLPAGVRGMLVAALLAATMSSLDSALNSLSAATMRDFVERGRALSGGRRILILSRLTTVAWGVLITGFAFLVGGIAETIIEAINKIGSAFYGPIVAAFLVGVGSARATAAGVFAGVIAGVALNLGLWLFLPELFWMWWNLLGLAIAVAVTLAVSRLTPAPSPERLRRYTLKGSGFLRRERPWARGHLWLAGYFVLILALLLGLDALAVYLTAQGG